MLPWQYAVERILSSYLDLLNIWGFKLTYLHVVVVLKSIEHEEEEEEEEDDDDDNNNNNNNNNNTGKSDVWLTVHRNSVWIRKTN